MDYVTLLKRVFQELRLYNAKENLALDDFLKTTTLKPDKYRSKDIQLPYRDENGNLVGHDIRPSNAENQHEMLRLLEKMTNHSSHVLSNTTNFRPFGTDQEKFFVLLNT